MKKLFLLVMIILGFNLNIKSSDICEKLFDKLQSLSEEESFKLNLFLNSLPPLLNSIRSLVAAQDLQKAKKALEDIFESRNFPLESKEIIEYIKRNQLIEQIDLTKIISFINASVGVLNKETNKEEFVATFCPKAQEPKGVCEKVDLNVLRKSIKNKLASVDFKAKYKSFEDVVIPRLSKFINTLANLRREDVAAYVKIVKQEKLPEYQEVYQNLVDYIYGSYYPIFYTVTGEPKTKSQIKQDSIDAFKRNTARLMDFLKDQNLLESLKQQAKNLPSLIEQGYAIICKL